MSDNSKQRGIKIRYEQHDILPFSARVFLNDIDISGSLFQFSIDVKAGEVTTAQLVIRPDEIEVDAQTMAVLTVLAEEKATV